MFYFFICIDNQTNIFLHLQSVLGNKKRESLVVKKKQKTKKMFFKIPFEFNFKTNYQHTFFLDGKIVNLKGLEMTYFHILCDPTPVLQFIRCYVYYPNEILQEIKFADLNDFFDLLKSLQKYDQHDKFDFSRETSGLVTVSKDRKNVLLFDDDEEDFCFFLLVNFWIRFEGCICKCFSFERKLINGQT